MSLLKLKNTKERIWATAISAVISSGPAFLVGVTLGFPSVVLVDLDLSNTHSDIFGVRIMYIIYGIEGLFME